MPADAFLMALIGRKPRILLCRTIRVPHAQHFICVVLSTARCVPLSALQTIPCSLLVPLCFAGAPLCCNSVGCDWCVSRGRVFGSTRPAKHIESTGAFGTFSALCIVPCTVVDARSNLEGTDHHRLFYGQAGYLDKLT